MHQDRTTDRTIARICATEPFRGATVAEVVPLHQRSICYRLHFTDGRSVFVKQALGQADGALSGAVPHEAKVLRRLRGLPLPAPQLILTLADDTVLVVEDVAGAGSLDACRQAAGGTSPAWARAAARSLAAVHGAHPCATGGLPETVPAERLVRGWTVVSPREVTQYASGFAEALRHLRRSELVPLLHCTAAGWSPRTLIHGDVKSDNILCGPDPAAPHAARLVDWEAAGVGDPRWDVGCLIGDYLFTWLSGIDLDAGPTLDDWVAAADPPFGAVQADIAAAALEYESLLPVSPGDRQLWVRFAGFFLLQRLCSAAVHSQVLPSRSLAYLQVAEQLLRRPDECGELLLCP